MAESQVINFRLDTPTIERIEALAENSRLSKSDIIRMSIDLSLGQIEKSQESLQAYNSFVQIKTGLFNDEMSEQVLADMRERYPNSNWELVDGTIVER